MHAGRRGSLTLGAGVIAAALVALGAAIWWFSPRSNLMTTTQVLAVLPPRSTLHSFVQADLEPGPPLEAAAVALIPPFPGAGDPGYTEIVARYDRWRRRLQIVYREPLSAAVPVSVDAGYVYGPREAVLFQRVTDDGRWTYRVVGMSGGRATILTQGTSADRMALADPLLIGPAAGEALRWDGASFVSAPPPPAVSGPGPSVVWRYVLRSGTVWARTDQVMLRPRQVLRLHRVGGGPTPIILPDARLDLVENGYRARRPGTYAIRVLIPFSSAEETYVLTIRVADTVP